MAALALLLAAPASAHPHRLPQKCGEQATSEFIEAVWDPSRWRRERPKATTLIAWQHKLSCVGPGQRKLLRRNFGYAQRRFYHHRKKMLWRERVTPFYYAGHFWAVPYPIALCESGGDYFVGPYGAYGLIFEPPWQSPREQDLDAHRLYMAYGESPWKPYEGGCYLR